MDRVHRSVVRTRLVIPLMAMLLALSCSTGVAPDAVATATPNGTLEAAEETDTPTASGLPAPIVYGAATLVRGRDVGLVVNEGTVTGDAASSHSRDGSANATVVSNDPRVSGTMSGTWNSDRWGHSTVDGALVQWGTGRLTNAAGSWEGTYTGFFTTATSDRIIEWYIGRGAYEGFAFVRWITQTYGEWDGLIFPGTPPSNLPSAPRTVRAVSQARALGTPVTYGDATLVSGGTGRITIDPGTVTGQAPLTYSRNGRISYVQTSDDPRVAGAVVGTYNADAYGRSVDEGAVVEWGATRLENAGGAWVDAWAGFFTPETTDRVIRWYTGTGGYEGLSFVMWIYHTDVAAGTVAWTGLIFPGTPPMP